MLKTVILSILLVFSMLFLTERSAYAYTEYFSDDFETDDLNKWDGQTIDPSCSIGAVGTVKKLGSYGLECVDNATSGHYAYTYKNLSIEEAYCRFYVYLPTGFYDELSSGDVRIIFAYKGNAGNRYIGVYAYKSGTDNLFRLEATGGGGTENSSSVVEEDTWYCIEIKIPQITGNSTIQWWIDEVEQSSITSANIDSYISWQQLRIGLGWTDEQTDTQTAYFDEIIVADSYIGAIDTTPPADIAEVRDGRGADINFTYSASQLSANWDESSDPETGISKYWYGIGTTQRGTDTVGWTDNGTATKVTHTGLSLTVGTTYYFTVKAENRDDLESNATNSNGQWVENVGDTPPMVFITNPIDGASVCGQINMTADATDDVGVDRVEFYIDGTVRNTDTTSPYYWSWDTPGEADGTHTVKVIAYDNINQTGEDQISATVDNVDSAPVVYIRNPLEGTTVLGSVNIRAEMITNCRRPIGRIEFYIDGILENTDTISPYYWVWDTTIESDGIHTVKAVGYDATAASDEDQNSVTVDNVPDNSPTISITNPTDGSTVLDIVNITADASDDKGVDRVEFYIDGTLKHTDIVSPYRWNWDTNQNTDGPHTVRIIAYDTIGQIAEDQVSVEIDNYQVIDVYITNPRNGATLVGIVNVQVDASDDDGINRVEFYIDGVFKNTDTTSPYEWSWDTTKVTDGGYRIKVIAYNTLDQTGEYNVSCTVKNSPIVTITNPSSGTIVTGDVNITADATDDNGIDRVEFYIDGTLENTDTTSPYSWSWNTTVYQECSTHTIKAIAYDTIDQQNEDQISVTVDNVADDPPTVSITNPSDGETVAGSINIIADANDDNGVSKVEFYIDGILKNTDTDSPYSWSWDTTVESEGGHTIKAIAYDTIDQQNEDQISVTVKITDEVFPNLKVYPNPFVRSDDSDEVKFTGLPEAKKTILRIYTLSGKLVYKKEIDSGGEVGWNCTNEDKNPIVPGLYIYVLTDEEGNKKKTGKLVIKD